MTTRLLLIDCADEVGLVYKITGVLFRAGFSIVSNHEFVDAAARQFFMRTAFVGEGASEPVLAELRTLLPAGAAVRVASAEARSIVVLATKEPPLPWRSLVATRGGGSAGAHSGCGK